MQNVLYNILPVGLLTMLPKEFTREQVKDLRIKQGMSPDPRCMLSIWKKRGIIIEGESPNTYVRVLMLQLHVTINMLSLWNVLR